MEHVNLKYRQFICLRSLKRDQHTTTKNTQMRERWKVRPKHARESEKELAKERYHVHHQRKNENNKLLRPKIETNIDEKNIWNRTRHIVAQIFFLHLFFDHLSCVAVVVFVMFFFLHHANHTSRESIASYVW